MYNNITILMVDFVYYFSPHPRTSLFLLTQPSVTPPGVIFRAQTPTDHHHHHHNPKIRLMRHKDQLKKDILKKRALLEKELQMEVNRELNAERKGHLAVSSLASSTVSTTTAAASPSPAKPKANRLATPAKQSATSPRVPTTKPSLSRMNNENEAQNNSSKITAVEATQSEVVSAAASVGNATGLVVKDALTPANPGKRK